MEASVDGELCPKIGWVKLGATALTEDTIQVGLLEPKFRPGMDKKGQSKVREEIEEPESQPHEISGQIA